MIEVTLAFGVALFVVGVLASIADRIDGHAPGAGPRGWGLLVGVVLAGTYIAARAT